MNGQLVKCKIQILLCNYQILSLYFTVVRYSLLIEPFLCKLYFNQLCTSDVTLLDVFLFSQLILHRVFITKRKLYFSIHINYPYLLTFHKHSQSVTITERSRTLRSSTAIIMQILLNFCTTQQFIINAPSIHFNLKAFYKFLHLFQCSLSVSFQCNAQNSSLYDKRVSHSKVIFNQQLQFQQQHLSNNNDIVVIAQVYSIILEIAFILINFYKLYKERPYKYVCFASSLYKKGKQHYLCECDPSPSSLKSTVIYLTINYLKSSLIKYDKMLFIMRFQFSEYRIHKNYSLCISFSSCMESI